jgi:integrase
MGRPRTVNSNLPKGMYLTKGAYYFIDHKKKWINLGHSLSDAMVEYYKLLPDIRNISKLGDLFDRYMAEISPKKSAASYQSDLTAMRQLRPVMGNMSPNDLTPQDVYKYIDYRSRTAPVRVNREIALLSHVYTKGIRWGGAQLNPCRDVERNKERPRTRYITDSEFSSFKKILPLWLQLYVELKYLTALRQSDLLTLKFDMVTENGLLVTPNKTVNSSKACILIEWTPELLNVINSLKLLRNKHIEQQYFFVGRNGAPYTPGGFRSFWRTYMKKALSEKIIDESFQERDIRAKTASDIGLLSDARLLLGHESDKTTTKFYTRLPQKVRPLK